VGKTFVANFEPCCDREPELLGSAMSRSRGFVQVALARCTSCEQHQWGTRTQLDRPWANGVQAGMYLNRLRADLLAHLYG